MESLARLDGRLEEMVKCASLVASRAAIFIGNGVGCDKADRWIDQGRWRVVPLEEPVNTPGLLLEPKEDKAAGQAFSVVMESGAVRYYSPALCTSSNG